MSATKGFRYGGESISSRNSACCRPWKSKGSQWPRPNGDAGESRQRLFSVGKNQREAAARKKPPQAEVGSAGLRSQDASRTAVAALPPLSGGHSCSCNSRGSCRHHWSLCVTEGINDKVDYELERPHRYAPALLALTVLGARITWVRALPSYRRHHLQRDSDTDAGRKAVAAATTARTDTTQKADHYLHWSILHRNNNAGWQWQPGRSRPYPLLLHFGSFVLWPGPNLGMVVEWMCQCTAHQPIDKQ